MWLQMCRSGVKILPAHPIMRSSQHQKSDAEIPTNKGKNNEPFGVGNFKRWAVTKARVVIMKHASATRKEIPRGRTWDTVSQTRMKIRHFFPPFITSIASVQLTNS